MPVPALVREPVPEIAPAKVRLSERAKARVPLVTTSPERLPVVPPLPTCRVPAEIVVPPVWLAAPVSVRVPAPIFSSGRLPPASVIAPLWVALPLATSSLVLFELTVIGVEIETPSA